MISLGLYARIGTQIVYWEIEKLRKYESKKLDVKSEEA